MLVCSGASRRATRSEGRAGTEYRVRWKGYGEEHCRDLVAQRRKTKKKRASIHLILTNTPKTKTNQENQRNCARRFPANYTQSATPALLWSTFPL